MVDRTPLVDSMETTAKRPMDQSASEATHAAQVTVVFPPHLRQTVLLPEEALVLGRRPGESGLKLDDPSVSRRHFAIEWDLDNSQHIGSDLGSRNGSRVEGEPIAEEEAVYLDDGDVIRVGDVLLVYETGSGVGAIDAEEVSRDAVPGDAASMVALRRAIANCARDPSPVLLVGETGTGKEYVARELHRLSQRAGTILAINCAALSPQLIESQLFGHAKGSFTGAESAHEGLFRAAHGGTLFLDEIGELPSDLQPKLLRVLQEKEVLPVGETRSVKIDVRVVSATLRDLTSLRSKDSGIGNFRLDLYARLSPWEIRVPALRERRADLLTWIERLRSAWFEERGEEAPEATFEANATERLLLHDWPDNLRGVDRLVHRVCSDPARPAFDIRGATPSLAGARSPAETVESEPPPPGASHEHAAQPAVVAPAAETTARRRKRRPRPTKGALEAALEECGGSVRATAKQFNRDRRQIYRWIEYYGLRTPDPDAD